MSIYQLIVDKREQGEKALAVLLDPDKLQDANVRSRMMKLIASSNVDFVFVGGSLVVEGGFNTCLEAIKAECSVPMVLFPGSVSQLSPHVDALLYLSLISGRNPELLIGQHVVAATRIKQLGLEAISTGYMLVDCGSATTASYISGTLPIPYNKPEIAAATAMAGEMLGLSCMYLDGGSGADKPVAPQMVQAVRKTTGCPIIVGGGIRTEQAAADAWAAGADLIVIGTAFEENPDLLFDICSQKERA